MTPEEHSTLREMLGAFSLGHLSEAEATAVQAHLDGCADCRRDLAEIAPLAQSLTHVSAERVSEVASPDPELGRRIAAAVAVERAQHRRRARSRRSLLVAAAVLAVAAVGGVGVAIGNAVSSPPAAPAVPIEAVDVASRMDGVTASAGVVAHTWGVEIKLEAVGLAAGDTYDVVVVTADGQRRSAGAFVGVGAETMNCNLNSDVLRPDAVGFQVLDDSGQRVLVGEL